MEEELELLDDSKWYKPEEDIVLDTDDNLDDYELPADLAWED